MLMQAVTFNILFFADRIRHECLHQTYKLILECKIGWIKVDDDCRVIAKRPLGVDTLTIDEK